MSAHAFIDETKTNGLLVAVAVLAPRDLAPARTAMRALCLPGQSRLHFIKERQSRRRIPVVLNIYDATAVHDQKQARAACLRQIVVDLAAAGAQRLVLEQDDSLLKSDQVVLYDAAAGPASPPPSPTNTCRRGRSRCCGSRTLPPGAGLMGQGGSSASPRPCATSAASEQREARLTHRPEGCRAHFRALLHPASTTVVPGVAHRQRPDAEPSCCGAPAPSTGWRRQLAAPALRSGRPRLRSSGGAHGVAVAGALPGSAAFASGTGAADRLAGQH